MSQIPIPSNFTYNSTTVAINASNSGDNTIVSAVAGKVIAVLEYAVVGSAAVTIAWKSSGGSVLGGPIAIAANGGLVCTSSDVPWLKTVAGEGLVLNLSGAIQTGGHLTYVLLN